MPRGSAAARARAGPHRLADRGDRGALSSSSATEPDVGVTWRRGLGVPTRRQVLHAAR